MRRLQKKIKKRKIQKESSAIWQLIPVFCLSLSTLLLIQYAVTLLRLHSSFTNPTPYTLEKLNNHVLAQRISDKDVEHLLLQAGIAYASVISSSDYYVVQLSDNHEVLLSSKKDLFSQVASLQVILPRLTIEGKKFTRLDFRFDKPLLVSQ